MSRKLKIVLGSSAAFAGACVLFIYGFFMWNPKSFGGNSLTATLALPTPVKEVPVYNPCTDPIYDVVEGFIDGQSPAEYSMQYGTGDNSSTLGKYRDFYMQKSCKSEAENSYDCKSYAVTITPQETDGCLLLDINVRVW